MKDHKSRRYMTAVYRYAFSRLVLHYTLYYEVSLEHPAVSEREQSIKADFDKVLTGFLQGEAGTKELDRLRGQIGERAEIMTAYSDCFQIYEYVLNRIERRFSDMPSSRYTPGEMAGRLAAGLADMEQAADRNSRLRGILSHLPVRFTRQKFYDMVTERFTVYTGLSRESVENFLHMLKTAVMVRLPENMDQEEELSQALSCLKSADYRSLDKAGYDRCREMLARGVRALEEKTELYVTLQEMANELYMLVLTEDRRLVEAGEEAAFRGGLKKLQTGLAAMKGIPEEEFEEILSRMEGVQESVEDIVMSGNPLGNPDSDRVQKKLDKLTSGSAFMSLEEKEESCETADREWVEEQAQVLCRELDGLFAGLQKPVVRSVMARVLASLPVMFQNDWEMEEYIRASLESCADLSEREACLELLEQELMDFDVVV